MNNNFSSKWISKIANEWNGSIPHLKVNSEPTLIHVDQGILMCRLIWEEYTELKTALRETDPDKVEIADALGDMTYLIYGAVSQYGLQNSWDSFKSSRVTNIPEAIDILMEDVRANKLESIAIGFKTLERLVKESAYEHKLIGQMDDIMDAIHTSNLTKLIDGELKMREDMKVLKPETFKEPDLSFVAA